MTVSNILASRPKSSGKVNGLKPRKSKADVLKPVVGESDDILGQLYHQNRQRRATKKSSGKSSVLKTITNNIEARLEPNIIPQSNDFQGENIILSTHQ